MRWRRSYAPALALAVATASMFASRAQAQSIPSAYRFIEGRQEAGVFVGQSDASSGRFGFGPQGGMMYGGRWGIELSGPVSLEGVVTVVDGTRDVINPRRVEGDRVVGAADALLTSFDARFKFSLTGDRSWHRLSPFLVAGGGIVFDAAGDAPDDDLVEADERFSLGTKFVGVTGLGTRWFVTDRLTLRLDGTFSLYKLDTPPGFSDPETGLENVERGEWVRSLGLTLGALLRW